MTQMQQIYTWRMWEIVLKLLGVRWKSKEISRKFPTWMVAEGLPLAPIHYTPFPTPCTKTTPWNTPNHRRRIKRRPLPLLLSLSFFYAPTPQTHCPPWVGKFKRQEEGWMLTLRRDAWALAVCAFRVETSFISVSIFRISSFISPPSSSSSPLHPSPLETLLAGGGRSMVDCQERRHCYNILYSTVYGQFRYHVSYC